MVLQTQSNSMNENEWRSINQSIIISQLLNGTGTTIINVKDAGVLSLWGNFQLTPTRPTNSSSWYIVIWVYSCKQKPITAGSTCEICNKKMWQFTNRNRWCMHNCSVLQEDILKFKYKTIAVLNSSILLYNISSNETEFLNIIVFKSGTKY